MGPDAMLLVALCVCVCWLSKLAFSLSSLTHNILKSQVHANRLEWRLPGVRGWEKGREVGLRSTPSAALVYSLYGSLDAQILFIF